MPDNSPLTLTVSNLETHTAPIIVGVYGPDNNFPGEQDQLKVYTFRPNGEVLNAQITDLPYGEYAMAIYQDVNENGKIDKNWVGIPTEPYGFSNNVIPHFKAPSFEDCKFDYNSDSPPVEITLIRK
ncbi:MAG: hypothetical protein JWO06_611 [Bacteroidota bacterium]|nr:hypothetical protein [Bacteroidota bacterium]